jgi:hypothetical protein
MVIPVLGGAELALLASDSLEVVYDGETGREKSRMSGEGKVYALSDRFPLAVGLCGYSEAPHPATQLRARFDGDGPGRLEPDYTVDQVARAVARHLHATLGRSLRDLAAKPWPRLPADAPPGARPEGKALLAGYVVGFNGAGGPPETWWICITGQREPEVMLKQRGDDTWHAVVSPGAHAAAAEMQRMMAADRPPITLDNAARLADYLVAVQSNATADPVYVCGPMRALALFPDRGPLAVVPTRREAGGTHA